MVTTNLFGVEIGKMAGRSPGGSERQAALNRVAAGLVSAGDKSEESLAGRPPHAQKNREIGLDIKTNIVHLSKVEGDSLLSLGSFLAPSTQPEERPLFFIRSSARLFQIVMITAPVKPVDKPAFHVIARHALRAVALSIHNWKLSLR